jgi:DNA repair ATPase RecN
MAFLNLGSFGEGFVTGFATEANKALKDSIERINTRVDKLKQFQLERAIKDQDKRRAEIEENRKALERAYAVLGGDANAERAIAYAGGLLKQRGSVEAFNQRIDELQKAKDAGYDIMQYFDRASVDAPLATLDD